MNTNTFAYERERFRRPILIENYISNISENACSEFNKKTSFLGLYITLAPMVIAAKNIVKDHVVLFWFTFYIGLLLVHLYAKPKHIFISFKILGGAGLFTMIATSGVSWGSIKTIYWTLYSTGRRPVHEFREIRLSGPFYKGKYRENGQNRYFFFAMLIYTKKTVRWKIKLYPIWKENERGFQICYRQFCQTSPWRHNDVRKLTLFVIFRVF